MLPLFSYPMYRLGCLLMNRFIDNCTKWLKRLYKVFFRDLLRGLDISGCKRELKGIHNRRVKRINRCLLILLTVAIVSACTSSTPDQSQSRNSQTASTDCRLVKHEMGETEICGQPQRVVSLSPYLLDYLLALGVQPIAHSDDRWDPSIGEVYDNPAEQILYLGQWVETKPISLGDPDAPSLEALVNVQPDLILGEEYQNGNYALMTQIAPTLLFNQSGADEKNAWQHNINEIAIALDREAEAEVLLTRHSQRVVMVQEQLASVVAAHPRVLVLAADLQNNRFYQAGGYSTAARLLQTIGFEIVSSENSSILPGSTQLNPQISIEILPQIEADLICVLAWSKEHNEPQKISKQQWVSNPILNQVSAFKEGKIFFVDEYLWGGNTRGPLTDCLILEALPELLLSMD